MLAQKVGRGGGHDNQDRRNPQKQPAAQAPRHAGPGRNPRGQPLQVVFHFAHGLVTVGAILAQRLPDDAFQSLRYPGISLSWQLRFLVQDGVDEQGAMRFREGTFAGGKFVQHCAECPDVGTAIGRFTAQLLGSHVGQRPCNLLRTAQARRDRQAAFGMNELG